MESEDIPNTSRSNIQAKTYTEINSHAKREFT